MLHLFYTVLVGDYFKEWGDVLNMSISLFTELVSHCIPDICELYI